MKNFVLGVALLLAGSRAVATDPNPFVALYEHRLELIKTLVEREKIQVKWNLDRLQRGERMYQSHSMSLEELNELKRHYELSVSNVTTFKTKVLEAASRLEAVRVLAKAGAPIPLSCGGD